MERLLERDDQLARLRALLTDARDGRGRVAFVGGEAGIGKSSLIAAFAGEASTQVRVAVGRCDALVTPRPLGPMLDVAAALGVEAGPQRDALLSDLMDDVRRRGPALIVIEDAHWADDATIDLLVMLGRRVAELPVLLVVTYRDDEVNSEHPLRQAIGDLVTASSTSYIGLEPLSRAAVQVLADQSGRGRGDDLFDRTGGNPFFVTETLAATSDDVPTSVRLAVLARAARLDPSARLLVDAVSVVPGRAESWLVDGLCSPTDESIDACIAAGVLTTDRSTYSFRHELARLAIESDVAGSTRRQLNQRAVDTLVGRDGVDPGRIAHHAEAAGDDRALATSARQAALIACDRTAHREAVSHGDRAMSVRQFFSADELADLQTRLATPLVAIARGDEAGEMARGAVAHWRAAGDDRREAQALLVLSWAMANLGDTASASPPLVRAVEILERYEPGPELALAYIRLTSSHMLARERDTAVEWGERAIALATQLGDASLLGRALIETGTADVMDGRFDGLARVRKGVQLGRDHVLPGVVAQGLSQIGSGCGEMRRYEDAVPALVEGAAFTAHHSLEAHRRYHVAWLGRCRFDLGQWDEAEVLSRDAMAGSRAVATARFVGLNTLGWLRARRGDNDVFELLDEALDIARDTGHLQRLWPCAVARAEAGWLNGQLDPHVPLLEEVFELARRCRHGVAVGEIGLWLQRGGALTERPSGAVDPFASWIDGEHMHAIAAFRQMGCPYETASVLVDTDEVPSLREALATFQRLGALPMADTVVARLRARGVRVAAWPGTASAAPRDASGLTDRELEVLKLVAAGFTNPQIAAALYISRKTAEHHVSNILMKLGATTRSEAAATAIRLGLAG